jgi:dienelactone hydrolase
MKITERRSVRLNADGKPLEGRLTVPKRPLGVALFATGTAGARHVSFAKSLADRMHDFRLATYVMDLVSPVESDDRSVRSDIELLCNRLDMQCNWLQEQDSIKSLPIVICGLDTGAAVAAEYLSTAQCDPAGLAFLNGRLDLVDGDISGLDIPLLFFVDTAHEYLLTTNRTAYEQAAVGQQHKNLLHDVDSDAVPVVTRWARSRIADTEVSLTDEERTDSRHSAF